MGNGNVLFKERAISLDLVLCERLNLWLNDPARHRFFAAISRLGDGLLWYTVVALLPLLAGKAGLAVAIVLLAFGIVNALGYRSVKLRLMRLRPFVAHAHIRQGARTLDEYSFPSGHTLHATTFGIMLSAWYWPLAPVWLAFALLTGLSRVVLGLHYPSDVGAALFVGIVQGGLGVLVLDSVGLLV